MRLSLTTIPKILITCFVLVIVLITALSAEQTVGLFKYSEGSSEGYTLFAPLSSTTVYLIDNYGRIVHTWESEFRANNSVYLLQNGNLLHPAKIPGVDSTQGGIEILDWDGNVLWQFQYSGQDFFPHHDVEILPNGNILMIARETKSMEEAVAAGRDPALLSDTTLMPEYIIEIEPTGPTTGNIVWEWHVWDHLVQDFDDSKDNYGVVADHPELLDVNYILHKRPNWNHVNSIDYNPELDQIILSCRHLSELWIIDHSTTTEEASSHTGGTRGRGGDFIYRWGNPQAYDAGTDSDQQFFVQHDPHWITDGLPGAGNILVFNNGDGRPEGNYSTVVEISAPVDGNGYYQFPTAGESFDPEYPMWIYQAPVPEDFYSAKISGAQRLPNGNTLICSGNSGRLFEVTTDGDIVWEYISPVTILGIARQGDVITTGYNDVFRAHRYAPDYPGLAGRELTPGGSLELYQITVSGVKHAPDHPTENDSIIITAMIESDNNIVTAELYADIGDGYNVFQLYDDGLHHDQLPGDNLYGTVLPPNYYSRKISYYVYAEDDFAGHQSDPYAAPEIAYSVQTTSPNYICGDANGDISVNVSDAVHIVNFVFVGGQEPLPYNSADANCDTNVNVSDAVFLINYIFTFGNQPCDPNGDEIPDC